MVALYATSVGSSLGIGTKQETQSPPWLESLSHTLKALWLSLLCLFQIPLHLKAALKQN